MSTSDSSRFLKMGAGIVLVIFVVGGALYLGTGGDSTDSSSPDEPSPRALPDPAPAPTFEVTPHQAELGASGVQEREDEEEDGEAGSGARGVIGPSSMMLKMATDPTVSPASAQDAVEGFVEGLVPAAESCWKASSRERRATWNLVLRVTNEGLETSKSRLRGVVDYDLELCLAKALTAADRSGLTAGTKAHWPVRLDPRDGVEFD